MSRNDPKLRIKQTYTTRCENCLERNIWLLRDTNVNVGITDEDIYGMSSTDLSESESGWCDHCDMKTLQTKVAYALTSTNESETE